MDKLHNHNTVYILGAGASRDAGMPLVADFLHRMRDSVEWLESEQRAQEVAAVQSVIAFRHKTAAAAYRVQTNIENIEELFSLAAASEAPEMTNDVATAIAATLDYCAAKDRESTRLCEVATFDNGFPDGWEPPAPWLKWKANGPMRQSRIPAAELLYAHIGERLYPVDARRKITIVTFNYDLVGETLLSRLGVKWRYGGIGHATDQLAPGEVEILKLHGSINWGQNETFESYAKLREASDRPAIVPPTWQKNFSGRFLGVWNAAVAAIKDATRIGICGFSIPATDTHFKYLLAAGLRDNVSLRNVVFVTKRKDEGPEKRLRGILREELFESPALVATYDQGIAEFVCTDTFADFLGRPQITYVQQAFVTTS